MEQEIYKFSLAGSEKLREMEENSEEYAKFLKFQGRIFKHTADVALEFFVQNPNAEFIATEKQWNSLGININDGEFAISFTDDNGNVREMYDFSQTDGKKKPKIWSITAETASEIKENLGISQNEPMINGILKNVVSDIQIQNYASLLQISPKNYPVFKQSFNATVSIILAGRLEIGGNNFAIKDEIKQRALAGLRLLKRDFSRIDLLTFASNCARKGLLQVEQTIKNQIEKNILITEEKQNDLRKIYDSDGRGTGTNPGLATSANSAGVSEKRLGDVASGTQGRNFGLDDNEIGAEQQVVSDVQNTTNRLTDGNLSIRPDVGDVQIDELGNGNSADRGALGDLRTEVDDLGRGEFSASDGTTSTEPKIADNSQRSGEIGTELQGSFGERVPNSQSATAEIRGNSEMGGAKSPRNRQQNNEGASADTAQLENEKFQKTPSNGGVSSLSKSKTGIKSTRKNKNFSLNNGDIFAGEQLSLEGQFSEKSEKTDINTFTVGEIYELVGGGKQTILAVNKAENSVFVKGEDWVCEAVNPQLTADGKIHWDYSVKGFFESSFLRDLEIIGINDKKFSITFEDKTQTFETENQAISDIKTAFDFPDIKAQIAFNHGKIACNLLAEKKYYQEIAKALDDVIHENTTYGEMAGVQHVNFQSALDTLSEKFDGTNVYKVVATLVNERYQNDGRISHANKKWAKQAENEGYTAPVDSIKNVYLHMHATIFDGLADTIRENSEMLLQIENEKNAELKQGENPVTEPISEDILNYKIGDIAYLENKKPFEITDIKNRVDGSVEIELRDDSIKGYMPIFRVLKKENFEDLIKQNSEENKHLFFAEKPVTEPIFKENKTLNNPQNIEPPKPEKTHSALAEKLYKQFEKMFPNIFDGTHETERYGNLGDAFEPLSVEHLDGKTYSYMTFYEQNGDIMHDPNFVFEIDKDEKTLNISEYQMDGVPKIGTVYQQVYDENGVCDRKLLSSLEKNFMQNLKNAESANRKLSAYRKDGERFEIEEDTAEEIQKYPENADKSAQFRRVLNEFSEKHGFGELNFDIADHNKLTEKLRDGTFIDIGEVYNSNYDVPFTSDTLKIALENFANRTPDITTRYDRKLVIEIQGGVTPLPQPPEIYNEIIYAPSPRGKIWDNIQALSLLKRLEEQKNGGTSVYEKEDEIKRKLALYCGWGGLPQVFDDSKTDFDYYRTQLKQALATDSEIAEFLAENPLKNPYAKRKEEDVFADKNFEPFAYKQARATTLNAHYTPQIIIDSMYSALKNMAFPENIRILEPSCGTGNFIRRLPSSFENATVTGIEIDETTAKIADYLTADNENISIKNCGFENSELDNESYDLAVGNVPFGNYKMVDPDHSQDWLIHDAFFRKSLDKVAPGGVVAFVTSSGTLDKQNPKIREYLAIQADLIGAVRLPNTAFSDAGTKVTADIIFLKKRNNPLEVYDVKPDWCYVCDNSDGLKINSYFVKNPQMVLGKIEKSGYFDTLTCTPFEGKNLKEQLDTAMKNISAKVKIENRERKFAGQQGIIKAFGGVKNFTFTKHIDNKIYYRTGENMTEIRLNKADFKQMEMLCEIREKTRKLIDYQKTSVADEFLIKPRTELNVLYDNYKAKFGVINSAKTAKLFGNDADFPLLKALERLNPQTNKFEKSDIFHRRTVYAETEITSVETVEEALQTALDRKGKVDIAYMSTLLNIEPEKVVSELFAKNLAFSDPEKFIPDMPFADITEKTEYLSGNVRQKLKMAESALDIDKSYQRNIDELQKVIPQNIKADEIEVKMGCAWVDCADYTAFLKSLSGRNSVYDKRACEVSYSPNSGEFEVAKAGSKIGLNVNENTTYGTSDFNMYQLAEKLLNQRQIVVKKDKEFIEPETGKKIIKSVADAAATRNALEKSRKIAKEFKEWIFKDEQRAAKYERKYNDIFNSIVGREYDGSKLTFAGMNDRISLKEHQKNAVARALYGGNTLLAHVVGAGKSYEMFTSVMKKKQLGLINKACVVVPKSLTEQTANEWLKLYPNARLLNVTNDDLSNENARKLFTAKCVTGDFDAVIMSSEQYEKIAMSRDYQEKFLKNQLHDIEDMLKEKMRESKGKKDFSVKDLERTKRNLQNKLERLINPKSKSKGKDDFLEFEQLGFDYLVADECHAYKNGFVITKMTNVAGVTSRPSGRAEDMQMKCDYLNETYGNGHILFASGTPISNSMTELYVMTRYLRPDILRDMGISRFDDWAATFGNVTTGLEQTAYDTFKLKTRFSNFANLPELMRIYKEFADIKSAEKLNLPRPNLVGGKPEIVKVQATPEQTDYVRNLALRAEKINGGGVNPSVDNMLLITHEARLLGLGNLAVKALCDKRDVENPSAVYDLKNGKVDACVEKVFEIYKQTNDKKSTQIIFSDIAVNSDNGNFSCYEYIRDELISKGIPENEIIFAPKADNKERPEIFRKVNSGDYRIVLASTDTMGTGVNIQQKLFALHNLDVPWKPSNFEQREGRILRQGNENPEVEIFNYITEGTLDSYLYATVTNKARFIAQLLDNEAPSRVCEDCDEKVLTFAELGAAAAGNPDIKDRIETANKVAELTAIKREYNYETAKMREKMKQLPENIEHLKTLSQKNALDIEKIKNIPDLENGVKINGKDGKYAEKIILDSVIKAVNNFTNDKTEPVFICKIGDFELSAQAFSEARGATLFDTAVACKFVLKGEIEYTCDAGMNENSHNLRRLDNLINKMIENRGVVLTAEIEKQKNDLTQAENRLNTPFEREEELVSLVEKLDNLDKKLSGIIAAENVIVDSEDVSETPEEKSEREKIYDTDESDLQPVPEDDERNQGGLKR